MNIDNATIGEILYYYLTGPKGKLTVYNVVDGKLVSSEKKNECK